MMEDIESYQIEVMSIIGYAVIASQELEAIISLSLKMFSELYGQKMSDQETFTLNLDKEDRKTLGQLFRNTKSINVFTEDFEEEFHDFVKKRNQLIHRLATDDKLNQYNTKAHLSRIHQLATLVIKKSNYYKDFFETFFVTQVGMAIENRDLEAENMDLFREDQKRILSTETSNSFINYLNK